MGSGRASELEKSLSLGLSFMAVADQLCAMIGEKSPLHSSTPRKAKKKHTLHLIVSTDILPMSWTTYSVHFDSTAIFVSES